MRTRYTINERGELQSRDGFVLGRLTSLTLEGNLPAFAGSPANSAGDGGSVRGAEGVSAVAVENSRGTEKNTPLSPLDESVARVWKRYVELIATERHTLNATRRRLIVNALNVRDEATVIRAIEGLRLSSWHNGENEQRRKYLDIRYALKGNSARGESSEERIDRMAELAGAAPTRGRVTEARIDEAKAVLRRGEEGRSRDEATAFLRHHGIVVEVRSDGFPRFKERS